MKRLSWLLVLSGCLWSAAAPAGEFTWTGAVGTGTWSDSGNWTPTTTAPPVSTDTAIFSGVGGAVYLTADATVGNVDVTGSQSWTWAGVAGSGTTLTVNDSFDFGSSSNTTSRLDAVLAGASCALNVTGKKLQLDRANTYGGGTDVAVGSTLYVAADGALGGGTVDVNGTLFISAKQSASTPLVQLRSGAVFIGDVGNGGAANAIANDVDVYGGQIQGDNYTYSNQTYFTGAFNLIGDLEVAHRTKYYGGSIHLTGTISGPGKIVKILGPGSNDSSSLYLYHASNPFSGGVVSNGRGTISIMADGAAGTGSVIVNNGRVRFPQDETKAGAIIVNAGEVCLDKCVSPAFEFTHDITLNGGVLAGPRVKYGAGAEMKGNLYVTNASTLKTTDRWSPWHRLIVSGTIHGSGKLTVDSFISSNDVEVSADNKATFSGDWDLNTTSAYTGALRVTGDGALGANNAVTVNNAKLIIEAAQTYATGAPAITVNPGGTLTLDVPSGAPVGLDVTFAGGAVACGNSNHQELSGQAIMIGNLAVGLGDTRNLTISGTVTDGGGGYKLTRSGGKARLILTGPNTYGGGTDVLAGPLEAAAAGVLSSGAVYVGRDSVSLGGRLLTSADGVLDSVVNAGKTVTVGAEGAIDYGSAETKLVTVQAGGAVKHTGTQTYTYSGAGRNVAMQVGAILDSSAAAVATPTLGQLSAGTGHGLYLGKSGTDSTNYSFGPSSGIYRGLGVLNNGADDLTYSGTATSSGDLEFYVQSGGTLTLSGATLNVGASDLNFSGGGDLDINGTSNSFNGPLNVYCTGRTRVNSNGGLAGQTLNLHDGYLETAGTRLDGATVNIEPGGILRLTGDLAAGTVTPTLTLKGGVYPYYGGSGDGLDAVNPVYQQGAQYMMLGYGGQPGTGDLPGAGKANYICRGGGIASNWGGTRNNLRDRIMVLDDTRVTALWTGGDIASDSIAYMDNGGGAGKVTGTTGRFATAPYHQFWCLRIDVPVELDTLIVGDTSDYLAMKSNGTGMAPISQDGRVYLTNAANSIGAIEVEAGVLHVGSSSRLGGAATIDLKHADTVLRIDSNATLAAVISGSGTVNMGSNTLTLGSGGAMSPGASVGQMKVIGGFSLAGGGQMQIEMVSDDGNAGTDHDLVTVTANATLTDGELVLNLPVPSKTFQPATLNATILTAASVTGSFSVVSLDAGMDPLVAAQYDVSGLATYPGGAVTLVGTGTTWTAHKGDADLNDEVDVLDLAKLANNFGRKDAGVNWVSADFDLNGEVDVLDLAAIANAFGWKVTGGEGGAPVPEPMTLAVLALGGAVLIRRRRR